MQELETMLRTILSEKENKLLPENLKAGVTCLGVNGTLIEGGALTSEEYDTCNNLAAIALGETPLIDDPNIRITLDVSNDNTITVEDTSLVIEEVVE